MATSETLAERARAIALRSSGGCLCEYCEEITQEETAAILALCADAAREMREAAIGIVRKMELDSKTAHEMWKEREVLTAAAAWRTRRVAFGDAVDELDRLLAMPIPGANEEQ